MEAKTDSTAFHQFYLPAVGVTPISSNRINNPSASPLDKILSSVSESSARSANSNNIIASSESADIFEVTAEVSICY